MTQIDSTENHKQSLLQEQPKLILFGALSIFIGLLFLVVSFFLSTPHSPYYRPFWAFLLLNMGGLLVFVACYTLLSEAVLKRTFARQLEASLDEKINQLELSRSIAAAGIAEIKVPFSAHDLHQRVKRSQSVKIIAMRNSTYLNEYHEDLRNRIAANDLILDLVFPNPRNNSLMDILSTRYRDMDANGLAESIAKCINVWVKAEIYDKLGDNEKAHLTVRLEQKYPLYSAYLFDREELWYIPYHHRDSRHAIPVIVYRPLDESSEIYRDVVEILNAPVHPLLHEV